MKYLDCISRNISSAKPDIKSPKEKIPNKRTNTVLSKIKYPKKGCRRMESTFSRRGVVSSCLICCTWETRPLITSYRSDAIIDVIEWP